MKPKRKENLLPIFVTREAAEAFSDKVGDAYYEVVCFLEGRLNLCIEKMIGTYAANATKTTKAKCSMQRRIVREVICPANCKLQPETLAAILKTCKRYAEEETAQADIIKEAATALNVEMHYEGSRCDFADCDEQQSRSAILRLCDWIESRIHWSTHRLWYNCPLLFSDDQAVQHLASIGFNLHHLACFGDRDTMKLNGILARAADEHAKDLKTWGIVGKVQYNPQPITWTHPKVDSLVIGLWPLLMKYNWTYSDMLNVLHKLLPQPEEDWKYPLDGEHELRVHCRSVCGLTKLSKGKTAPKLPEGWAVAEHLFGNITTE
jgi:hypothetical protein